MKFQDLDQLTIENLKERRYDRIVGKHEGPETWKYQIERDGCEFIEVDGEYVLFPLEDEQRPNISMLKTIRSVDGNYLTVFLKDTTFHDDLDFSGFIAICRRFGDEAFYTTIVYHEWFIIDYSEN